MSLFDDVLFDTTPADDDDDVSPGLSQMIDVIRCTRDPLALPALADLLRHPHPSIRGAAVEALETLNPSSVAIRRQLGASDAGRVRAVLGRTRTSKTRHARATLRRCRDAPAREPDSDGETDDGSG